MNTECQQMKPIIDWLTYRSYEWQRLTNPDRPYFSWRKIYKDAAIFEEIYEENLNRIYRGE